MKKTLALCGALIICAAMLAPYSSTQTTKGGGGVKSFNTRTGVVTLQSSDVTTALGYTPATALGFTPLNPANNLSDIGNAATALGNLGAAAASHTHSASDITSGTLPNARFPATLPAASGVNLTALNGANIASGTVAAARLGSGTPSSSNFLRGDGTWATASPGYTMYVALLTQSGTSAPTATVLANTLGGTPTYSRSSAGGYMLQLSNAFTSGKTVVFTQTPTNGIRFAAGRVDASNIELQTVNGAGSFADSLLSATFIEVRVYP